MDDTVGNLLNFAADFFSRIQVQLDSFARAALENAEDRRIRLQTDFILSWQIATEGCDDESKKK
jgi:hypothetical protein